MPNVLRYAKPLDGEHLEEVLSGGRWPTEPLPNQIPLAQVEHAVESIDPDASGTAIDALLLEPLHRALPVTRREAADPRVWQWLSVSCFPDLVWRRWAGEVPDAAALHDALAPKYHPRFLARSSLNGMSRNTLSRLWWTAEHLGDYELARRALSNQDMFQNIFERFFGMYPPAARACLTCFHERPAAQVRAAAKWLQQCATTTLLEALDEAAIRSILAEALP
jgi:hypothetical protein